MTIAPRSADRTASSADAGPRPIAADRRNRARLRELCDEVLASFRAAREHETVSANERTAAQSFLAGLTPALRR